MHGVPQLAHVARPVVPVQRLERPRLERREAAPLLLLDAVTGNGSREPECPPCARAGRHAEREDVEPIEEVGPERPARTASARSRFELATSRTSTSSSSFPPTRRNVRVSRTRRNFTCSSGGISVTSSRKSVPPWAISKVPARRRSAPVNEPFSCPKSSLSTRVGEIAPQLTATNGPRARRERACTVRAATSLPVPLSPVIITGASEPATRAIRRKTSCIAGDRPTISPSWPAAAGSGCAAAAGALMLREARERRREEGGLERLEEEVVGARPHRLDRGEDRALARQDEDGAVRPGRFRGAHDVEPVPVRQPEVGDADVRRRARSARRAPPPPCPRPKPRIRAPG